jgi:hypothetical protein
VVTSRLGNSRNSSAKKSVRRSDHCVNWRGGIMGRASNLKGGNIRAESSAKTSGY